VRIEVCVDVSEYDLALMLQASRIAKMPLDALVKKAIADYVERLIAQTQQQTGGGG
jgi:hypothetical protein